MEQKNNNITIPKKEYDNLLKLAEESKKQKTLIWESFDKGENIPVIFSPKDLLKIEEGILKHKYQKNIYGVWMRQRNLTIFYTIYLLGLRPNEACDLRFDDFSLETGLVKIRKETNKQKRERRIPIPRQLLKCLQDYLKFPRHLWKGSPYLFPSAESPYISPGRWKHFFRDVLKSVGLWLPAEFGKTIPPYRSYTLRHTRATELLNKSNMDIHAVANILGHCKLDSTKKYLHNNPRYQEYLKEILESDKY